MKYGIALLALTILIPSTASAESCIASVYTTRENGTRTASGIPFSDHGMTIAHKTLKFGTKVRITNKHNGKSAIFTVSDRGPFRVGRCADLSLAGARALGFDGLAPVTVEVVR